MDLDSNLLSNAFIEAMKSEEGSWVTPGRIRHLALGMSAEDFKNAEADEAYGWIINYIRTYGVAGNAQRGQQLTEGKWVERKDGSGEEWQHATFGPEIPAPEIPPATKATLCRLGGSVRGGLDQINETPPDRHGFLRAEWRKVYRGAAA